MIGEQFGSLKLVATGGSVGDRVEDVGEALVGEAVAGGCSQGALVGAYVVGVNVGAGVGYVHTQDHVDEVEVPHILAIVGPSRLGL